MPEDVTSDEVTDETSEETLDDTADEVIDEVAEETVEETTDEGVEEMTEDVGGVDEGLEGVADDTADELTGGFELSVDVFEEAVLDVVDDGVDGTVEETADDAGVELVTGGFTTGGNSISISGESPWKSSFSGSFVSSDLSLPMSGSPSPVDAVSEVTPPITGVDSESTRTCFNDATTT